MDEAERQAKLFRKKLEKAQKAEGRLEGQGSSQKPETEPATMNLMDDEIYQQIESNI
jgi:hypothetical protein